MSAKSIAIAYVEVKWHEVATVDEKWSIDTLDCFNWTTWKSQMCHLLLAMGLGKLIDCTEVLAENVNVQTQAEFQRISQRVCILPFSTNVLVISTPHLCLVTSCK